MLVLFLGLVNIPKQQKHTNNKNQKIFS